MEPGGRLVGQIWPQTQLKVEGMERLWNEEKEKSYSMMRGRPQSGGECGSSCKLTSLSTLVGTVATLLAVITPSERVEIGGNPDGHSLQRTEPGMENILIMDYWMVLPVIVMVVTSLIMRVQRHLGETWKPGEDGPILDKVEGANLPIDGGGTGAINGRNY